MLSKRTTIFFVLIFLLAPISFCKSSTGNDSANGGGTTSAASISISPTSGPIGTLITIAGTNLDLSSISSVTVNGTSAIIVSKTTDITTALVMPGSTTGALVVTTGVGTASASFTVSTGPVIATQQGSKLVGTGSIGNAQQGYSVAISADGNTAILGGYTDNSNQGAVWVFTRTGTTWSQQGSKLVGTGNTGAAYQGTSVAVSADGNTILVGGYADNSLNGAVWVFTRSGTTWSQQGAKLVGSGNTGTARQGLSVALSADGNTAIIGGDTDNSNQGAVWVFSRGGTTWSQQGSKLVGTGNTGAAFQGQSVALSADGNTAIVGGPLDNTLQGATWVFTRSGTTWSQQGSKLVGTGITGIASQGRSLALNADGNTAIIGGHNDNTNQGAVWVFTRSGTTWSQQGSKLVGTGNTGAAYQGESVALSADGNTAIVGGYADNTNQGAIWVFARSGTTWSQQGSKLVGTGNNGAAYQGLRVTLSADGKTSIAGGYQDNGNLGAAWVWVP